MFTPLDGQFGPVVAAHTRAPHHSCKDGQRGRDSTNGRPPLDRRRARCTWQSTLQSRLKGSLVAICAAGLRHEGAMGGCGLSDPRFELQGDHGREGFDGRSNAQRNL